ncbi:MAG: alanine:cation symporter family protein [Cyanobacteria bacterium SIG26]|nr:alanine:cation symporter family protein [Cyanobacteria bacterium SIG26]
MKKFLTFLMMLLCSMQSVWAMNVDQFIDKNIAPVTDAIAKFIFFPIKIFNMEIPIIVLWILIAGIFFTFYYRGIAAWGFKHAIDLIIKPGEKGDDCGEVSSFQALATALSGTIGIGSIAGVAISISLGGPGAAFWIFAGAILGMSIKFVEATLAVKYRRFNLDGSVSGGPMHYIAHGLTRKGLRKLGQPLSVLFAILCIGGGITGGNMIQINQTAHQLIFITGGESSILHGYAWIVGTIAAILIGLVVMGGIKGIARVTTILTPAMCLLYIISGLIVMLVNIKGIPAALGLILQEAFSPKAVSVGFLGVLILGLRRSVQSNEAGTGAAAIVYAAAQTKETVSQGFVALLETFLTGVLCLFTSVVIVVTGAWKPAVATVEAARHAGITPNPNGIELASAAFQSVISFFPIILSIIAVLFAMSTLISWAYYGQKAWTFLLGEGKKRVLTFNIIYCLFIIIGSAMNVDSIINITDAMMVAMCVPNVIVLYILAPEVKKELKAYCQRHNLGKLIYKKWHSESLEIVEPTPVAETATVDDKGILNGGN